MKKKIQEFQKTFKGEFFTDTLHTAIYATDASVYRKVPIGVAFPKDNEAIKQLISFAGKNNTSLIPRTAGTSLAGQCVGEGIVVDVSKHFTKIISVDTEKRTVTLQPGVIRDELNQYLKPFELFFGPNTSSSNRCMIGGMVGNNSSGTTSIQYGVTRDKVLKLKTILSNGEEAIFETHSKETFLKKTELNSLEGKIYKTLYTELISEETQHEIWKEFPKPEIHRRNTGYAVDSLLNTTVFGEFEEEINLCKLLCGSEGTLAFTTEITLQLDVLPPQFTAMVATHYETLEACLKDVVVAMQHNLHTCEMMDNVILDCTKKSKTYEPYRFFVKGNPKAILLLELKSNSEKDLVKQIASLLDSLKLAAHSYHSPVLRGEEIEMALELRKAGLGLLGNMVGDRKAVACIEDTAVTLEDLPSYITEFSALMKKYDQQAVYYAHAGAGELHLRPILNLKEKEGVDYFRKITTDVAKLCKKYNGSFSGEHGDGIVRAEFIPLMIGEKNYELLKRIKTAFDPQNIFNPGKVIDAYKMDESLRYDIDREEPKIKTLMDFSDSEGILRLAEKCNGSGDCRKTAEAAGAMCPSYHATKNEKDTTRARANALREVLTNNEAVNKFNSKELKEVFDLCISCKACASECPSNVDISTAKAEFLYQYNKANGVSFSNKLFGKSTILNKMASKLPKLSNWFFVNSVTSKIIKKVSGIHQNRSLPKVSIKSFSKSIQTNNNQLIEGNLTKNNQTKNVLLFVDEFSNYLDAEIAMDSFLLLTGLGYKITVIDTLDSGRALISKGFLEEAKKEADRNITFLKDKVSENVPLIGIEPSAILSFRDEYLRLAEDKASAENISKNTFLIEEFLAAEIENGNISAAQFTSEEKHIKIHSHCHQKSLSNQKVTFDILNLPINYKPTIITSGCCGMAGSFGYEKEHYEVSMKIGELKLFPAVRKSSADTMISSNGTSCRHQILDGTNRKALHPVTILKNALL
ncbi:FAD-binding and (Fe-S)-binding domain-containing protein [Aequorivita lipolytica]|uniref:FAD-binding protein n=1 Tax=Aequorivita lipolytica TaxID=153267 RepID=A0A5C6YLN5_9FLAO|nr:FAD-binding and (Fe-S)-binding domain-containing protein [Aequorivita lipolytica]TXD68471.1 FAD-binding protein [Aequorivita lipolytica]SRX51381.1 Anaerobic glycerol-3-phosphate dehydrogenase subunit C [Aequorivita lipolytica]